MLASRRRVEDTAIPVVMCFREIGRAGQHDELNAIVHGNVAPKTDNGDQQTAALDPLYVVLKRTTIGLPRNPEAGSKNPFQFMPFGFR